MKSFNKENQSAVLFDCWGVLAHCLIANEQSHVGILVVYLAFLCLPFLNFLLWGPTHTLAARQTAKSSNATVSVYAGTCLGAHYQCWHGRKMLLDE